MIREANVGNVKVVYPYSGAVENEVDLPHWCMTGVGCRITSICVLEAGGSQEERKFPVAPERIEITCNNDFFVCLLGESMQLLQLVLPMSVFERKVDDEHGDGP